MPCTRPPSAISDPRRESACAAFHLRSRARRGAWKPWTRSSARSIWPRTFPFPLSGAAPGRLRAIPPIQRHFDAAFNSLEHLHIFAKQRGVTIALENTPGELATPANLRQFIADTRLTDLRLCFDIGHAHLGDGVAKPASRPCANWWSPRTSTTTTAMKDEHLAPYEASADDGKPTGASGHRLESRAPGAEVDSRWSSS